MKNYSALLCLMLGWALLPLSGCMYSTAYEIPSEYAALKTPAPSENAGEKTSAETGLSPESAAAAAAAEREDPLPALIDAEHPLPEDYVPEALAYIGRTSCKMVPDAAKACEDLLDAAEREGVSGLHVVSAYRSYQRQTALFLKKLSVYRNLYGAKAETLAAAIVAPAGESEHQSGLAVDICAGGSLVESFGATPEGIWLKSNCPRFGFVIRYPEGKSDITGITYEPWHLRYVGAGHAKIMSENGWCLEEYLDKATPGKSG